MGDPEAWRDPLEVCHALRAAGGREGSFWEARAQGGPVLAGSSSATPGRLCRVGGGARVGDVGAASPAHRQPHAPAPASTGRGSNHTKCRFGATDQHPRALVFSGLSLLDSLSFPTCQWGWHARPQRRARTGAGSGAVVNGRYC